MTFSTIELVISEQLATITINRPQALNALNGQVLQELDLAIDEVLASKARVAIITGAGEKSFVAGADIKEINGLNTATGLAFAQRGQQLFMKIEEATIPFIAAVNGFALGGGLELALACDFIYLSATAKIGLPECTLGLIPGFGGTVRLARKISPGLAKEWMMTGGVVSAEAALRAGLANQVCPADELLAAVNKTAKTILERAPLAIASIKKSVNQTYGLATADAMAIEAKEFSQILGTADSKEGTAAFIDKRKPEFKGK